LFHLHAHAHHPMGITAFLYWPFRLLSLEVMPTCCCSIYFSQACSNLIIPLSMAYHCFILLLS
jgi:hypothetical protein